MNQQQTARLEDQYRIYCSENNVFPEKSVISNLHSGIIDIPNVSRWDYGSYIALMKLISSKCPITHFALRFSPQHSNESGLKRRPQIPSRKLMSELCRSIANFLILNPMLESLELDGMQFTPNFLEVLYEGLIENKTLRHLSFCNSSVGDKGVLVIEKVLKRNMNITSLNLSNCNISHGAVEKIAFAIQIQSMHHDAFLWKESLRNNRPDVTHMKGLKCIHLNHNPRIGDRGVIFLTNVVKDSRIVEVLELRNCGITNFGSHRCLMLLKQSKTMEVLDVNENDNIGKDVLDEINKYLPNNNKIEIEFKTPDAKKHIPWRIEERLKSTRIKSWYTYESSKPLKSTKDLIINTDEDCNKCLNIQQKIDQFKEDLIASQNENKILEARLKKVEEERDYYEQLSRSKVKEEDMSCIQQTFDKFQTFLSLLQSLKFDENTSSKSHKNQPGFPVNQLAYSKISEKENSSSIGINSQKFNENRTDSTPVKENSSVQKDVPSSSIASSKNSSVDESKSISNRLSLHLTDEKSSNSSLCSETTPSPQSYTSDFMSSDTF